ncbi:MAG TPA: chaperone modulator CbpM [Thermomicrobiales bacterium]
MTLGSGETRYYRLEVAARLVGLSPVHVRRYVASGLVRPAVRDERELLLSDAELARLRKIRRLRVDLGLNEPAIGIVLSLLDEVESLRRELARYAAEVERGVR